MHYLVVSALLLLSLLLNTSPATASSETDFHSYMKVWDTKIELASQYLKDAESEFKRGDELQGCFKQTKAAQFGIEATESLIKAFEISGSTDDMSNINSGLEKWKELRDFC